MATNNFSRWIGNIHGLPMLTRKAPFLAGASQAVKAGEMLSDVGGYMTPQSADAAMTAELCFAAEEIKSGDRAGYYPVIVPQPGDIFRSELASASNPTPGASVYFDAATTEKVALSGTNVIGKVWDHNGVPPRQGHAADDASGDEGTTIADAAYVDWVVKQSCSYYAAFQA